jgi:phosphoglycolate phosphatase
MPGWTTRLADSARNVKAFDLIIFDFDGTLADSARGIAACMQAAFDSFSLPAPALADVRRHIGLTLEESIRQLTPAHPDVDVAAVAVRYRELHSSVAAPAIALFPEVVATLSTLVAAGIRLVVVSQKGRRGLVQLLVQLEIARYFDLVLGSDDVSALKPSAALYEQHVAPRYPDVARERVLVVGDTPSDLQFAVNIGASGCWAEYGYGDGQMCRSLHPVYRISDIRQMLSVCGSAAT